MSKTSFLIGALAGMAFPVLAVFGFYWAHEGEARYVGARHGFDAAQANAYKHVTASRRVGSLLLSTGFSDEAAGLIVDGLGRINEALETMFKPNPDSTAEITRDLANNYAGMLIALAQRSKGSDRDLVLDLVKSGALFVDHRTLGLNGPKLEAALQEQNLVQALSLFDSMKPTIENRIANALSIQNPAGS